VFSVEKFLVTVVETYRVYFAWSQTRPIEIQQDVALLGISRAISEHAAAQ